MCRCSSQHRKNVLLNGRQVAKHQYQVSYVPVEAKEVDPAAVKGNPRALPTMSPAPARSCPRSRPCSQSVCRGARLAAHPASSRAHSCACPFLASQVVVTELTAPMLAEPVSQQSVTRAARYRIQQAGAGAATVLSAVCHHVPDRLHLGQLAAVGMAPQPHPRLPVSTVPTPTPHRRHAPSLDAAVAAGAGLAARPGLGNIPHCVRPTGAALPSGQPPGLIRPLAF